MIKKKKILNRWLMRLIISLAMMAFAGFAYNFALLYVPDRFIDASSGLTIFGRSFSILSICCNLISVIAAGFAIYFFAQAYEEWTSTASRKKRTHVVVGRTEVPVFKTAYSSLSVIAVLLLVGFLGTMTSEPSSASTVQPDIMMTDVSYTKIAETRSPTSSTRYQNAVKKTGGKVIDTMQGGTTDGEYLYFAYENATAGGIITKFSKSGELLKKSTVYKPSQIGHANGLTYDSTNKRLVLAVYQPVDGKTLRGDRLAFIDPTTLKITGFVNVTPKATVTNICYNAATNQYVSNGRLYDADFKLIKKDQYVYGTYLKQYGDQKTFGQGIACNEKNIFVIRYRAHKTTPHTHIYTYDWSGNLTAVYRIKGLKDEAENLFIVDNKLYAGVNNGSTYRGKTSDNKRDYYIRLNNINL